MALIKSLKNLGLNEKEARVYVALLQLGKATAYSVAKHSGLKKPTTYVILDDMIDKGIVSKIPRAKTMQYTAISPEDFFSIQKNRLDTARKEALPELKALSRGRDYKVRARYYEGLAGIKEMYKEVYKLMPNKEYVGFYAHEKDAPPELVEFFKELNEKYRKLNIRRKVLTVRDPDILQKYLTKEMRKRYNVVAKSLPKDKYNSNISIEVFKNYTQIFSHRHLQAVVIDNPDIARVMKQIFNLVWAGGNKKSSSAPGGTDKKEPPKGPSRVV